MKLICKLNLSNKKDEGHISQIVTGFMMLKNKGIIDLEINRTNKHPFTGIVEVILNNKMNILYDMADGYVFDQQIVREYAKNADFYFKRSFNESYHSQYNYNIYPIGFNYHVTTKGNILDKPVDQSLISQLKWYTKEILGKNYHQNFYVDDFEFLPRKIDSSPMILFITRTWSNEDGLDFNETFEIDNFRAECIRGLKKEYGNNFIGGFSIRDFAKQNYPDCLLDESITNRMNFMRLVKNSDICISTIGLHKSNGWKLGEYIAASKAIVSEKLHYEVTGDFSQDKNYLEFTTVEECVKQTTRLFNNKELIYQLQKNNQEYYHNFLRPDKLVLNSLMIATGKELGLKIS